mmetsp:Transcript_12927/g.23405  ORF Transcript_12927/g.23405 Transcript_12927/m.23405 type:complete len:93 (-) Transcript_12927:380-658(-)
MPMSLRSSKRRRSLADDEPSEQGAGPKKRGREHLPPPGKPGKMPCARHTRLQRTCKSTFRSIQRVAVEEEMPKRPAVNEFNDTDDKSKKRHE